MIKKLTLLAVSLYSLSGAVNAQSNVEYHEGLPFPKLNASSDGSKAFKGGDPIPADDWFCKPFSRHTFHGQASINIRSRSHKTRTASYSAPNYWSIESIHRVQTRSEIHAGGSAHMTQPLQETLTSDVYNEIYKSMRDYLFSIDIPDVIKADLELKLNDFVQSYSYLATTLRSTHGAVIHNGSAGKGNGFLRRWSRYEAHVNVDVVCKPPEAVSKSAAMSTLRRWIDQEAKPYQDDDGDTGTDTVENIATDAKVSAVSTFPGYSTSRINDGDTSTKLGGGYSWANNNSPSREAVTLTWSKPVTFSTLKLFTTASYPLSDYQVQYNDNGRWMTFIDVTANSGAENTHVLPTDIQTDKIRVLPKKGPRHQTYYVRINEIEVYGSTTTGPRKQIVEPIVKRVSTSAPRISSVTSPRLRVVDNDGRGSRSNRVISAPIQR